MQQKPEEPDNWALPPMKSITRRALPPIGFAVTSGILLTLGLLFFINVLTNYRADTTEPRPLLVVDLTTWPMPVKQKAQPPSPKPEKQRIPKKTVSEKVPPPPKPKISPLAKERTQKIPPEPVMHEPVEKVTEKIVEAAESLPAGPPLPMQTDPMEDALPTPVPVFRLTQAPRFLHRETPVYPETMRVQGISGAVKLEVLIDKEGRVRKVNILTSAGKYFDEAAKQAILASSFYPAKVKKKPVPVLLRLPVKFDLL